MAKLIILRILENLFQDKQKPTKPRFIFRGYDNWRKVIVSVLESELAQEILDKQITIKDLEPFFYKFNS